MKSELPVGWVYAKASDVCVSIPNGSTPKAHLMATRGDVPFVKVYNLTFDGSLDFTRDPTFVSRETHETLLRRSRAMPGDVLMNIVGPPLGKVSVLPDTFPEWNFNQAIVAFRARSEAIDNRYLANFLSHEAEAWASKFSKATVGQHNVAVSDCRSLEVPLPPINEQRRIVAKLDALLARSRHAKQALASIPALIERFRQSVLAAAFRGDLTRDWREQNPEVEPVSTLLAREARSTKRRVSRQAIAQARAAGAKFDDLPSTWELTSVARVAELQPGYAFKSSWFSAQGIRLLRGTNIVPGATRWEDTVHLSEERRREFSEYELRAGDLVIAMDRPFVSAGLKIARLTSKDVPSLLLQRVGRFRLGNAIYEDFLLAYLNSDHFKSHIRDQATGTQLPHISGNDIESAPLPLPPLAEQEQISRRIGAAMAALERMSHEVTSATSRIAVLESTILQHAFRGELVPQEPSDEPASALLQRIRAERDKPGDNEPRPRSKRRRDAKVA
ncbi:restriction endonuclease subunit S [Corallococcus caeni]|uniref:restriction endonuclease subunit S n=1 Tax=Corallococcus caeni TaxID=3082388 RepID=UPI002956D805|nr:restriction endonuclease subunit S [Corallococcus sp. KH5-1]